MSSKVSLNSVVFYSSYLNVEIVITDAILTRFSGGRQPIDWKTINSKIGRHFTTKKNYKLKSSKQKTDNDLSAVAAVTSTSDNEESSIAPR